MRLEPPIEAFTAAFAAGRSQVVCARLVADLDTPVSLMLRLTEARRDSFLLESVTGGEVRGRFSIMGMKPDLIWQCRCDRARLNRAALNRAALNPVGVVLAVTTPDRGGAGVDRAVPGVAAGRRPG